MFIKIKIIKMGCGGNSNVRQVEIPKELTIYGNILDN
jgi:hypothetical protein